MHTKKIVTRSLYEGFVEEGVIADEGIESRYEDNFADDERRPLLGAALTMKRPFSALFNRGSKEKGKTLFTASELVNDLHSRNSSVRQSPYAMLRSDLIEVSGLALPESSLSYSRSL